MASIVYVSNSLIIYQNVNDLHDEKIQILNSPKPTMPRVSPRMRAHPEAASFSCSGPVIFLPSLTMLASQKVRRYKLRMRHSVESATSSTPYPGTLQTAMPSSPAAWKKWKKKNHENHRWKNLCYLISFWTTFMITNGLIFNPETLMQSSNCLFVLSASSIGTLCKALSRTYLRW